MLEDNIQIQLEILSQNMKDAKSLLWHVHTHTHTYKHICTNPQHKYPHKLTFVFKNDNSINKLFLKILLFLFTK